MFMYDANKLIILKCNFGLTFDDWVVLLQMRR